MIPSEQKKDETQPDDVPFVNDECGDYMWEEALKKFEENEKKKSAPEQTERDVPQKQVPLTS
jgi:hypothetical protein